MRETARVTASADFPYADRFPVHRTLPEQGRPRAEVLAELEAMATEEDRSWEGGKVSGTMYCGDHEHYAYLTEAFGRFAHVNALQRDLCPSATRFEGEIVAMTLDLMHAGAVTDLAGGGPRAWSPPAGRAASCTPSSPTESRRTPPATAARTWSSPRPRTWRSTRPATCSGSSCAWSR